MRYVSMMAMTILAMGATFAHGAESVKMGETVPELQFKDIRYLPRTFSELGDAEAYVVAFITNTCPLAQRYAPKLVALEEKYADDGVQFLAVNVGHADSITEMAWHALEYDIYFPVVKDVSGDVATILGATRTPEVVVLDKEKRLRYRGRVDDQYRLGGVRPEPSRHDLEEAIKEVLAGEEVSVPETTAEGCLITRLEVPKPEEEVTFYKDIQPILNNNCVTCHRPNGGAPFSLMSYRQASARADMVAETVEEGRMPPWYAHPEFGAFMDDPSLPHSDRLTIQQWLLTGKKEGNPEVAPEMPEFVDKEWQIEPDLIVSTPSPVAVPKTGFVPYVYQFIKYEFTEDTYVEAIEIKPTNPKVMHHANLVYTPGGYQVDADQDFLTGYVPGGMPSETTEGIAWVIPKGAKLVLQQHLVTTGQLEKSSVEVGLRFAKGVVNKKLHYHNLEASGFKISPYDRAHRMVEKVTLDSDVTAVGLFSHMHLRGRDMTFYATRPGEEQEVLMTLPNYSFDWQLTYRYPPGEHTFPKDTEIEVIAHYDNSPWNPYNPAPEKTVTKGAQTVDEMFNGFFVFTKNDEELGYKIDPNTGHVLTTVASNN